MCHIWKQLIGQSCFWWGPVELLQGSVLYTAHLICKEFPKCFASNLLFISIALRITDAFTLVSSIWQRVCSSHRGPPSKWHSRLCCFCQNDESSFVPSHCKLCLFGGCMWCSNTDKETKFALQCHNTPLVPVCGHCYIQWLLIWISQ